MDKYLVPNESSPLNPERIPRHRWKRSVIELNGRFESEYRHEISGLIMQSYSEIGAFPHLYHIDGEPCRTHMSLVFEGSFIDHQLPIRRQGISGLEFDAKGIYLVSVTKSGCLTVHDFESLYCQSIDQSLCMTEDEKKHLLHISTNQQLDVVKWNPANQDEVACASMKSNEVLIYDISYVSSEPVEVLRKKHALTVHGCGIRKGLSDIAFTSVDHSRLLASDAYGVVDVWDRRMSDLPSLELTTNSQSTLNSIQFDVENQIVFGAGRLGIIYMWDLRGGRTSAAFQSYKGVSSPPFASLKISSMLEKIGSLKAQSDIVPKEVHSIAFDPCCPYQLAFHLDDGWSGVVDIYNLKVTHIHCPPPAWLDGSNMSTDLLCLRKPSWLPTHSKIMAVGQQVSFGFRKHCKPHLAVGRCKLQIISSLRRKFHIIYAAGSSSSNGIHLLDFYPDPSSPCYVDYNEDIQQVSRVDNQHRQNRFIPLSEGVTACAAHPFNGTIVAGTKESSLMVISQMQKSYQGEDREELKPLQEECKAL